ncbi:MAG: response regulator transcription factor [Anaerolineae bacterium]|nr:response regulator transcription factor [Anaerolineae bacterium]
MAKKVNILLADDHAVVRRGVKTILESQAHYDVVAEAQSGEEAIEKAKEFHPDIAILDVRMPGVSGIEACRQITKLVPDCKVIMLTAYAEDELLFASVKAGASGFVLKLVGAKELIYAVEHVSHGEGFIDSAMIGDVFKSLHHATDARHAACFSALTSREMEVLGLLSTGMTNRQIGRNLYLAEGTIRNCVSSVLSKLVVANRAEAAAFAIRHQLSFLATVS